MADYFDTLVFSSSIIIFVVALVCIFAYEFFFRSQGNTVEQSRVVEKINRKGSKFKQKQQSDKVEK
jgi:Tfp pilus assembly protein PilO